MLIPNSPSYFSRMLNIAVRQGRSERRDESYSFPYGESLSEARTKLADFFRILPSRNLARSWESVKDRAASGCRGNRLSIRNRVLRDRLIFVRCDQVDRQHDCIFQQINGQLG
jgi:hypothetical protein